MWRRFANSRKLAKVATIHGTNGNGITASRKVSPNIGLSIYMPIFRCPFFVCCLNNCCRLFWTLYNFAVFSVVFSVFVISDTNFVSPFLPSQFSLPNFLVAQFSVSHFSRCRFSVAVISHINFVLPCFPTLSFFVADFSNCPNFRHVATRTAYGVCWSWSER